VPAQFAEERVVQLVVVSRHEGGEAERRGLARREIPLLEI